MEIQSEHEAEKRGADSVQRPCSAFDEWWNRVGRYYDPDTSDVPWEDKRRFLAELAFDAAMAQSRNYTADREVDPLNVTFANGRTVAKGGVGLIIGTQNGEFRRTDPPLKP